MNTSGEEKRTPRIPSPEQIELLDEAAVKLYRSMTPAERIAMAFEMNNAARLRIAAYLRTVHPDWSEAQIMAEVARRWLAGEIET